ncbi:restriction endonuclease subunit S [Bacteroides ovatus]|uniref:restriction endonuclease subunit S n=2 Tax=Bacteroidales TaxID=171549 RepID=UPI00189B8638|nr:restriction endonuclease subunit S [Bacteroides ovatus]
MADNKDKKVLNVPALRFPEFTEEWEEHYLAEYLDFKNGLNPSANKFGSGIKFISVMDILNNDFITYDCIRTSVEITPEEQVAFAVEKGDMLFQRSSETLEDVGRANVYMDDRPAVFGGFVIRGKKKAEYNPMFFRYLLASPYARKKVIPMGAGAQHFNIGQDGLSKVKLHFPILQEQQKIADLLRLINERISTQNKIIEDLKKLKSAISKHLFARKDLLETTICLSNIATLKNGYAFQSSKYNALGKWKILTITNVSGERYINDEDCNCIINLPNDIQDHQVLKEGDILISLTGNVGRVSLCKNGDYLLNQRVGLLQLAKNVNQEFLYQILSSQKFENSMIACGQGAAQMNIGKGDVESYVLPYSSNGNNILWVAKILHSYDECIINEMRRLTLLTMQKQYLLTQMFI